MKEQWRKTIGFSDYEVSNQGRVRRSVPKRWHPCHLLKGWRHSTGCTCVTLHEQGERRAVRVHILVAKAFLPNLLGLPTVNHKNGNKAQNDVDNLEWASSERQIIHAIQTGLHKTRGYCFFKRTGKWIAYIESKGQSHHLGYFATEEQAQQARTHAEKIYHNLEEIP